MQPSPTAETSRALFPNLRICIASPQIPSFPVTNRPGGLQCRSRSGGQPEPSQQRSKSRVPAERIEARQAGERYEQLFLVASPIEHLPRTFPIAEGGQHPRLREGRRRRLGSGAQGSKYGARVLGSPCRRKGPAERAVDERTPV